MTVTATFFRDDCSQAELISLIQSVGIEAENAARPGVIYEPLKNRVLA